MVKTTAKMWEVPEHEIDANFDPLVLLLIDACAAELEKIGYDISASQARLLDKLAELVVPEAAIGPKPSSCIMQATPVEPESIVDTMTRFYCTQRIARPNQRNSYNADIFFTPIGNFPLVKASLSFMMIGSKLFETKDNIKTLVHGNDSHENHTVQDVWLAIAPDKAANNLKGMSLFFDMRSHSEGANFYKSLESATCFAGDKQLAIVQGYDNAAQFQLSPEAMLVSGSDFTGKINRQTAGIYEKHFLHIAADAKVEGLLSASLPEEWQNQLPEKLAQKLAATPMVYLKIRLARPFYQDALEGLQCCINAFPVINRKLNATTYRTDTWINIIPLQIEGSFLDIQNIAGSSGKPYRFRTGAEAQELDEGEATVRSSGMGKTNSREVREIISSLTEAIRDESAYFSEISNEFILARLREISQILTRLEDQLATAKDNHAPHHYVLLRPKNTGDQVAIDYWTTNAYDANQVRSGTVMNAYNHTLVAARNAFTVTGAQGGREGVTDAEKRLLLRQQLASQGRLVSAEDIKLHCAYLFGGKLTQVEVIKGVKVGDSPTEGFQRTIDVILSFKDEEKEKATEEITYLAKELEHTLATEASPVYPFRVLVR
jgi:hypothetical protein